MNHTNGNQYCVVRYHDAWYALPSGVVREVMLCPDVTPLPNSSPILRGITHINNEFLTVTEPLLGEPTESQQHQRGESRQLLVVTGPDGAWGLLVDEVADLTNLDDFQPHQSSREELRFLGVATHRNHDLHVLDVEETYRSIASNLKSSWQHGVRENDLALEAAP